MFPDINNASYASNERKTVVDENTDVDLGSDPDKNESSGGSKQKPEKPSKPSTGGGWSGDDYGLGSLIGLGSKTYNGRTKTTPFLDKVEFTFERQGGSMKKGTVEMSKSMAIMIKQNPEQMSKYRKAAGKNFVNNTWSGSSKLTFNFADTIGINNYEKIRAYAMNPKNFAPGLYLTNVEKGTYYVTAKVYGKSYVDQSKIHERIITVEQDRNSNGIIDANGKVVKDKYGNPIKIYNGKSCSRDADKYYNGEYSGFIDKKTGEVSPPVRLKVVGDRYYKFRGVNTPRVVTSANTSDTLVSNTYIYEWWPHKGEELKTMNYKGCQVMAENVKYVSKGTGNKNIKPYSISKSYKARTVDWVVHVLGGDLTTEIKNANATIRPTLSK